MNTLNLKITNQDFGLKNKEYSENFRTRHASRGIVFDPKTNKVAMVVKTKIHEYKLPGGGSENNETEEETFLREIFEETGCRVKIIKKLGTVFEERSNMDLKQISAIFVSELIEDTKKLYPTKKEIDEGLTLKWMDIDEAISAVKKSDNEVLGDEYEEVYGAHFVIYRDAKILEFFKQDFLGRD